MRNKCNPRQNMRFLIGLTITILVLALVSIPDSFGHGAHHDTTPSQKLGDRNVILKFTSSPVYDPESNAREVSFQIVEEISNNIVNGTVFNIKTTITNEFIFEYTSESQDDGLLIMEFIPTDSETLSIEEKKNVISKEFPDNPPYDLVSIQGNDFDSGGLYFFEVKVLEAEEKVLEEPLEFLVQIPFPHKTYHHIEDPYFGKQVIRAVSYFDRTDNFQYDHKTRKISTEMPFEWTSESINRTSVVHQEFTIPKTFGDLMVSALKAKVNGVEIPPQLITLDEYWADVRLVHIILSHGDLVELQKRQDDSISGMKFELEPYQEDISFSSMTENGEFRIIVEPQNFEAGSNAKILFNIFITYPKQTPSETNYNLSILSGDDMLYTNNGKTTNSVENPNEIEFEIPENSKGPINLVFFEVGDNPFATTTLPIKVANSIVPINFEEASAQSDSTQEIFSDGDVVSIPEGTSLEGCEITDECYIPFGVKINVGDKVTWTNEDVAFHTVTSGNPTEGPDGLFDSGMFKTNEQFSHKFEESGNFDYFCTLHPWMQGTVLVQEALPENGSENGGGCLIATATYGSEIAPQVQQLRELRDNKLLQTETGSVFMQGFNDFYYSFSPYIADYERKNPYFKEAVKITITPMISSLSILNYVDMDSESEVLGYGISLILLNIGMYFGVPAIVIFGIKKRF